MEVVRQPLCPANLKASFDSVAPNSRRDNFASITAVKEEEEEEEQLDEQQKGESGSAARDGGKFSCNPS